MVQFQPRPCQREMCPSMTGFESIRNYHDADLIRRDRITVLIDMEILFRCQRRAGMSVDDEVIARELAWGKLH